MKKIEINGCLIGRFYFKKSSNGNLIGEFSNNRIDIISTESADLQRADENCDFIGNYKTTWQQDGKSFYCNLSISLKQNTAYKIYSLEWRDKDGILMFLGEGFAFDNILIGDYRDFEII